ncbi:DnaB-like helicase C-terminal domain-containing protein [Paratractidigestivibacter sp.]|uniref:DnaB-like helicase C-terminal domain-containing protein n=1 Tax=Paratractidigestivibacter sp. TaxID=2847316 RepID=UPI002ABE0BCF|nr:DnaB-like helicase C-terminal domain-containing protein [Paratractidigestivibacter sp.]
MDNTVSPIDLIKGQVDLKSYAEAVLPRAGRGHVCPCCKSGAGKNHTPAFSIDKTGGRWKCFSCGHGGDVLDLAGAVHGTDDKRDQIRIVAEWAGLDVSPMGDKQTPRALSWDEAIIPAAQPKPAEQPEAAGGPNEASPLEPGRDREREYIGRCAEAMVEGCEGWEYLTRRGLDAGTIRARRIGWDAGRRRVVLPWSADDTEYYHIDRDVTGRAEVDPDYHKYLKPGTDKVGEMPVYNVAALKAAPDVLFVVEGLFDAFAIEAAGYPALAFLSNRSNATTKAIVDAGFKGTVVLSLDRDKAGRDGAADTADALTKAGVVVFDMCGEEATDEIVKAVAGADQVTGCKDAGEALEKHGIAPLKAVLAHVAAGCEARAEAAREAAYGAALRDMHVYDPADTVAALWGLEKPEEPVPTGIHGLDDALDGGLWPGTIVLGAGSSMGKTTLITQIADTIAEGGRDVLFVTIEQSAQEIVAKSLSRIITASGKQGMSTHDMVCPSRRNKWELWQNKAMTDACAQYADRIAPHLRVMECERKPKIGSIEAAAKAMTDHDGRAPVVFIDYLQLIDAPAERMDDKRATDANMTAIRQMARRLSTPVIVLSSLNRASYSEPIQFSSFKESGSIEFSSDVLLGFQPANFKKRLEGLGDAPDNAKKQYAEKIYEEFKHSDVRQGEIVVLKQRGAAMPSRNVRIDFDAAHSTFSDPARAMGWDSTIDAGAVMREHSRIEAAMERSTKRAAKRKAKATKHGNDGLPLVGEVLTDSDFKLADKMGVALVFDELTKVRLDPAMVDRSAD